jgi:hypothetical protein
MAVLLDLIQNRWPGGLIGDGFDWRSTGLLPNIAPPQPQAPVMAQGDAPQEPVAQPTSLAPPPQPREVGVGDRIGASLHNLVNAPTLLTGLFGAGQGLATGEMIGSSSTVEQALLARGVDPITAKAAARNPTMLSAVAGQVFQKTPQGGDIAEYEYAKKNDGFKGSFQDWIANKRAGAGEYGLTPIWGTDAQGNPAFVQPGKGGKAIQGQLPPGFKVARDPIRFDAGTHWVLLDPQTRQPISTVPKDIAGKKVQEAEGEAQGTARANLPKVVDAAAQGVRLIDEMLKHPGRETATGLSSQIDPRSWIAGTDAADYQQRLAQVQGRTFLEAFQSLKGGGAITEIEGQKAEQAIARLGTRQSDAEHKKALEELQEVMRIGVERAKRMAAGDFSATPTAAPASATANASASDLKKKYGLD